MQFVLACIATIETISLDKSRLLWLPACFFFCLLTLCFSIFVHWFFAIFFRSDFFQFCCVFCRPPALAAAGLFHSWFCLCSQLGLCFCLWLRNLSTGTLSVLILSVLILRCLLGVFCFVLFLWIFSVSSGVFFPITLVQCSGLFWVGQVTCHRKHMKQQACRLYKFLQIYVFSWAATCFSHLLYQGAKPSKPKKNWMCDTKTAEHPPYVVQRYPKGKTSTETSSKWFKTRISCSEIDRKNQFEEPWVQLWMKVCNQTCT